MKSNPLVLFLCEFGSLNGGENSMLAVIPRLMELGWCVAIAAPPHSDLATAAGQSGASVYPLWMKNLTGQRVPRGQIQQSIENLIAETSPDLVHANSLSMSRILGPIAAETPTACSGHLRDIIRCSQKAISDINQLDRIVAVSQATANFHISRGMDNEKIRVVHNGVDLDRFRPCGEPGNPCLRHELGVNDGTFLALFVGQIGMRKGVESVIQAMADEIRSRDDTHLLIVGERHSGKTEAIEYEAECRRAAEVFGGKVHWLGRRTDVDRLMQQSDLLVHLPRQEPLGRVLIEAAACGLPIVTSDVGGSREILDGLPELMVPPMKDFSAAIDFERYRDPGFRSRIGRRLREMAEKRFSDRLAAKHLDEVFRDAVAQKT